MPRGHLRNVPFSESWAVGTNQNQGVAARARAAREIPHQTEAFAKVLLTETPMADSLRDPNDKQGDRLPTHEAPPPGFPNPCGHKPKQVVPSTKEPSRTRNAFHAILQHDKGWERTATTVVGTIRCDAMRCDSIRFDFPNNDMLEIEFCTIHVFSSEKNSAFHNMYSYYTKIKWIHHTYN